VGLFVCIHSSECVFSLGPMIQTKILTKFKFPFSDRNNTPDGTPHRDALILLRSSRCSSFCSWRGKPLFFSSHGENYAKRISLFSDSWLFKPTSTPRWHTPFLIRLHPSSLDLAYLLLPISNREGTQGPNQVSTKMHIPWSHPTFPNN
jgi:hypothetical protein